MRYFYTNDSLGAIVAPNGGKIVWENYGFSPSEIKRAVSQRFQVVGADGIVYSILPITDENVFERKLGSLISAGTRGMLFYRLLSEAEAIAERDRIAAAAQEEREGDSTANQMTDSEKLDLLIELYADQIGGAV